MSNNKLRELDLLLSQKEVDLFQIQENMSFLIKAQEDLKKQIQELTLSIEDFRLTSYLNNKF